jgi:hypothetical protein
MIDRVFGACRARNAAAAKRELADWFTPLDPEDFELDRRELLLRAEEWGDPWSRATVARELAVRSGTPAATG